MLCMGKRRTVRQTMHIVTKKEDTPFYYKKHVTFSCEQVQKEINTHRWSPFAIIMVAHSLGLYFLEIVLCFVFCLV